MPKTFRAASLHSLALLALLLLPTTSHAQSGIQMLPPLPPAGELPCAENGLPKVLAWDGVHPLYCIHNFVVDNGGNVGVTSLTSTGFATFGGPVTINNTAGGASAVDLTVAHYIQSSGLLVGPGQVFGSKDANTFGLQNDSGWGLTLTGNDVAVVGNVSATTYAIPGITGQVDAYSLTVLNALTTLTQCTTGQALTKTGADSFACIEPFQVPVCKGAGKALQFDGTTFLCTTISPGIVPKPKPVPTPAPAPVATPPVVQPRPQLTSFSVNPRNATHVTQTVSWSVQNASTCVLSRDPTLNTPSGLLVVPVNGSHIENGSSGNGGTFQYGLACSGPGGSSSWSVTGARTAPGSGYP